MKLDGPFIRWSCKSRGKSKTLPQCMWPPKLAGWQCTLKRSDSQSCMKTQPPVLVSHGQLNRYFHLHYTNDHHT